MVTLESTLAEAQKMGRIERERGAVSDDLMDVEGFTSTAYWANCVAPQLRNLAGCGDPYGRGTFTGETEDWKLDDVHEAFWDGFHGA